MAQLVKNPPAMQETPAQFLSQEGRLEKGQVTHSSVLGLPRWLSWEIIHLQCRRPGSNPWVAKIPWRRERLPTPVFWPGEFLGCIVHGVAESRTRLTGFHFHFSFLPENPPLPRLGGHHSLGSLSTLFIGSFTSTCLLLKG